MEESDFLTKPSQYVPILTFASHLPSIANRHWFYVVIKQQAMHNLEMYTLQGMQPPNNLETAMLCMKFCPKIAELDKSLVENA